MARLFRFLVRSDNDGHGKELLKGSSIALVLRVAGTGVAYLFTFVVARMLGASAVGAFALTSSVILVFGMISRVGLDRAIVKFVASSLRKDDTKAAASQYWLSIGVVSLIGSALALTMYLGADWLAQTAFKKPHLAAYFRLGAPAVLFVSLVMVSAEALRGAKRIGEFAFLRHVVINLIATPIVVVLAMRSDDARVAVIAFTVATGIAALLSLARAISVFRFGRISPDAKLAAMLVVAAPMFLSNSMGMIISWTDVLMLGRFVSDADVGIYSVAFKLAFATGLVLNAVNSISTPKFAELNADGDIKALEDVMRQTTRLLFITAVPILIILAVGGKLLLGLFGAEFTAGYHALLILVVGQFVSVISGPVGNLLQMTGNERRFLRIVIAMAILNIVLNIALIPTYGIVGAAIASAVTLTMNNLLCVVTIRRQLGFVALYVPFRRTRSADA